MKVDKKYIYSVFVSLVWFLGFSQIEMPPDDECVMYYVDNDRDGYGGSTQECVFGIVPKCIGPGPGPCYVTKTGDINDYNDTVYPKYWYNDNDVDGFGVGFPISLTKTCTPPPGNYADNNLDCNDNEGSINPNTIWYFDNDGDGLGDASVSLAQCSQPLKYVKNNLDQCPNEYFTNPNGCIRFSNENYIFTREFTTPVTDLSVSLPLGINIIESITYYDGLGREKQKIGIKSGGQSQDIVVPVVYDSSGRQSKEYLPYAANGTLNGVIYSNPIVDVNSFYSTLKYEFTLNPFSEKRFENSPLNRVSERGFPGASWQVIANSDIDNTIKYDYSSNTSSDNVRQFNVFISPTNVVSLIDTGYYADNQLYKNITKNENWKPTQLPAYLSDNTTVEFKDKLGNIVLKRTYNLGQLYDTYYVYNDLGKLTYVIPPGVNTYTGLPISTSDLDNLGYQYKYDERNRLVEKKLPGKDLEYIVYDKLDRPILTQDGNLRLLNKWLFTKYDVFNRPVYIGDYKNTTDITRLAVQNLANTFNVLSETKQPTVIIVNGTSFNYTNLAFPNTHNGTSSIINLFAINYYDNYDSFDLNGADLTNMPYVVTPITNAKGLTTCSKIRILDTANWITNVMYYDAKARSIYTYSKNDYQGTVDKVYSQLDFIGQTNETYAKHTRSSITTTIIDTYVYDHIGRLLTQKQKINLQDQELIASNSYDKLGVLESKEVGGASFQNSRLQKIDYKYNIRGWLKNINDINAIGTDLFAFQINYDGITNPAKKLFNGNISQTLWRTANTDSTIKNYIYSYDGLNRLTEATDNLNKFNESINYDKNGNIVSLKRLGEIVGGVPLITNPGDFGTMDNLTYNYVGNQLTIVSDSANDTYGFKDDQIGTVADTTTDYTYDKNGNMLSDANKGITTTAPVTYNHLNLPKRVTLPGGSITYVYDAIGTKQRKIVNGITTTDYAGGYIYEGGVMKFFAQPEGYVANNSGVFSYIYQFKDHLGNVRLSYADSNTDYLLFNEIIEENNYYAFGLKHKGYNNGVVLGNGNLKAQNYKYNGKELQDELGLNMYDFGARNYDPALGRWMNIDPVAEKYAGMTPYNYCFNNAINVIDPDGRDPGDYFTEEGKYLGNDGVDDEKVKIVKEGDYQAIEGKEGTYSVTKSTELKWFSGNNVSIGDFKFMSSVLYAESSGGVEETLGIYNVLENRAMQDGGSVLDQFSDKSPYGIYGVRDMGRLADEVGTGLGDTKRANIYSALIQGISTTTDVTNGAHFWDGKDFNGGNKMHGGYNARYKPGYTFTSPSHDLWGQGNNKTNNVQQYQSTNALGNTTFSKLINNTGKRWTGGTLK